VLKLIIEDDEGHKTVVPFVRDEITIGREEGNTIRLTERNVSRRHARLVRQNGHVLVEDLGSYNGIRINGEKIQGQVPIHDGDLIQIGDYDLALQNDAVAASSGGTTTPTSVEAVAGEAPLPKAAAGQAGASQPEGRHHATSIIRVDQVEANRPRALKDLDPTEAPHLTIVNTELAGREFACIRTELKIGRTDENDIAIDHRSLSRTHAKLVREDTGEWRIIDLASANGLKVNGETYAQATLRGGDLIELGHVQLRFVGVADSFAGTTGVTTLTPMAALMRRPGLLAAIAAGAVVLVAVFAFVVMPGESAGDGDTAPPLQPKQADAPVASAASAKEHLDEARSAVSDREFERAIGLLESSRRPDGSLSKEAEDLLDRARGEAMAQERLDSAERAIEGGKLPEARRLLDQASGTQAFASEHRSLMTRLEAAKAEARPNPEPDDAPPEPTRVAARPPAPDPSDQARKLAEDASTLLGKSQFREAASMLKRCVDLDPDQPRCHKLLGTTYAKLKQPERGAEHYRIFLRLAPNDPQADQVRKLLEVYDSHKKNH
jgi:pSer/pThr/pTyr-binding forkhead associated (FHA) protein